MAVPAHTNQSEVQAVADVTYKGNFDTGTQGANLGNGGPTPATVSAALVNSTATEQVSRLQVADRVAQVGVNR